LKHFLEFAERGPRAFAEAISGSTGGHESPFEQYVAAALQTRGWTIHTQIGASAFRIDLGVVHPDAPGIYLAGIECDGATYHRSATARDRDKLRQQVLRGLGWEILRVWSTDWWLDAESTLNKLDSELRSLLSESQKKRAAERVAAGALEPLEPGEQQQVQPEQSSETIPQHTHAFDLQPDSSRFFERSYDPELSSMIAKVIETEGPILDDVLVRRIARLHGWQRTGARITERVTRIATRAFKKGKEDKGTFFWPNNLEIGQPVPFRPHIDRSLEEICLQELVSLASDILAKGRAGDEAILAMARDLGLQRLGATSRSRLDAALARAQAMP